MTTIPRFGTDGLRGRVGAEINEDLFWKVGLAAAPSLGSSEVVIGRDTRESGESLAAALADGLSAGGALVCDLGVVPTPAVAHVAATRDVAGAVITASHNPHHDNGVKLLTRGGRKLDDADERAIVEAMAKPAGPRARAVLRDCGPWRDGYVEHLLEGISPDAGRGVKVVLDCANGAFSGLAPEVCAALGATVIVVHDDPDGRNINAECGATAPGSLSEAVRLHGADLGFAFDGDGDRVVAVDSDGLVVDGDRLIALTAIDLDARGGLDGHGVVVTVMTNSGFHAAMSARGIRVVSTPVGDRHVLAALDEHGFVLGGEQSGHLVFRRRATTGDGLLAAVTLIDLLHRRGVDLHDAARDVMEALPQEIRNVTVADKSRVPEALADEIERATAELAGVGRVLVRPSGTEQTVRVMVEASDVTTASALADRLATIARERLGEPR